VKKKPQSQHRQPMQTVYIFVEFDSAPGAISNFAIFPSREAAESYASSRKTEDKSSAIGEKELPAREARALLRLWGAASTPS
jgi:hypothetical protein